MLAVTETAPEPGPAGRHTDLAAGARAMAPWLLGVVPFGLVIGVSAQQADLPLLAGLLTAPLIYSGSAQITTIEMLDAGSVAALVVVTTLAINLRLVLYSASMAPHWQDRPAPWRALAAYLLVDPSFAVGIDRYQRPGDRSGAHQHYLGGAVLLWLMWLAAIAAGASIGARLPAGLHLEFVIPLFLLGELVPRVREPALRRAAAAAVVVAVLGWGLPLHLGPVAAMAAGVSAGLLVKAPSR